MRKLLSILLLFASINSFAHSCPFGSGSGSPVISSMTVGGCTLGAGDTLAWQSGTYSGAQISGVHDITITNSGGQVILTGSVNLGGGASYMGGINWVGSGFTGLFYGFRLTGGSIAGGTFGNGGMGYPTGVGINMTAAHSERMNFIRIQIDSVQNVGGESELLNCGHNTTTYNGTALSKVWGTGRVDSCKALFMIAGLAILSYNDPYNGSVYNYTDWSDSISFSNDSLINLNYAGGAKGGYVSGVVLHFTANHNYIYNDPSTYYYTTQDVGAFFFHGSGECAYNKKEGGRGYIIRCFGMCFSSAADSVRIHHNTDHRSWVYPLMNVNSSLSLYIGPSNPYLTVTNVYLVHNTAINNQDDGSTGGGHSPPWSTAIGVVVNMEGGSQCYVKGNLVIGGQAADTCIVDNSTPNGFSTPVLTYNRFFSSSTSLSSIGMTDTTTTYHLTSSSLLVAKVPPTAGIPNVDIYGVSNTGSAAIGSVDYTSSNPCQCQIIPLGSIINPQGGSKKVNHFKGAWLDSLATCKPPTINVNVAPTITLPTNTITVSPTALGNNGTGIKSWKWGKMSGSGITVDSLHENLTVSNLTSGFSIWQVTATDSCGYSSTAQVIIKVNAAPIPPPVVNPPNVIAVFSEATARVVVYATDPNNGGSISSYLWSKVSGPGLQIIQDATKAEAVIKGLQNGTYQFNCAVTNAAGKTTNYVSTLTINIH